MLARKALAGTAAAPKVYVEDVFSTYLYTGNGSTQTITNNIDLSTEGGLVWIKSRAAASHFLYDTNRGVNKYLMSNATDSETTQTDSLTAFNTTGFSINNALFNDSSVNYASWTFRQAKKFFDVVTYTGTGSLQTVSHNLGSVPGCIIIKNLSDTDGWLVYHRSIGATKSLTLNSTGAAATDGNTYFNDTEPTSTVFTVKEGGKANQSGNNYVAYLFAHNAGGFGDAGSDNVISCGSFTSSGTGTGSASLGFEPQFLIVKAASGATGNWWMFDVMREASRSNTQFVSANSSSAESSFSSGTSYPLFIEQDGFSFPNASTLANNATYIYIAIRRGPMKTPTTGTSVFETVTRNTTGANATVNAVITPVDLAISDDRNAIDGQGALWFDRLRGATKFLRSAGTNAEITASDTLTSFAVQNGYTLGADAGAYGINSSPAKAVVYWNFRRAPGFFDVVCYTATGSSLTLNHNLGVVPELMIFKRRTGATLRGWGVYSSALGTTKKLILNTNAAETTDSFFVSTTPTSTVFYPGIADESNEGTENYVAYLFASLSGVSKIGTYTGNGSSVTVTTNFQPRFILVKRTDSTGNWIVSDSARGLVSGSDPYLLLNSTAAEDTDEDWVDVSSTSFTVNQTTASNANVNTGTYLYLAIA